MGVPERMSRSRFVVLGKHEHLELMTFKFKRSKQQIDMIAHQAPDYNLRKRKSNHF